MSSELFGTSISANSTGATPTPAATTAVTTTTTPSAPSTKKKKKKRQSDDDDDSDSGNEMETIGTVKDKKPKTKPKKSSDDSKKKVSAKPKPKRVKKDKDKETTDDEQRTEKSDLVLVNPLEDTKMNESDSAKDATKDKDKDTSKESKPRKPAVNWKDKCVETEKKLISAQDRLQGKLEVKDQEIISLKSQLAFQEQTFKSQTETLRVTMQAQLQKEATANELLQKTLEKEREHSRGFMVEQFNRVINSISEYKNAANTAQAGQVIALSDRVTDAKEFSRQARMAAASLLDNQLTMIQQRQNNMITKQLVSPQLALMAPDELDKAMDAENPEVDAKINQFHIGIYGKDATTAVDKAVAHYIKTEIEIPTLVSQIEASRLALNAPLPAISDPTEQKQAQDKQIYLRDEVKKQQVHLKLIKRAQKLLKKQFDNKNPNTGQAFVSKAHWDNVINPQIHQGKAKKTTTSININVPAK